MNIRLVPIDRPTRTDLYSVRSVEIDEHTITLRLRAVTLCFEREAYQALLCDEEPGDWW